MDRIREFTLNTKTWGPIHIGVPKDDGWGVLESLLGTPFEEFLPQVEADLLSHALHGYPDKLMRAIGRSPEDNLKVFQRKYPTECSIKESCWIYEKSKCYVGPKIPFCFDWGDPVANYVLTSWKTGRYIVIPIGDGFVL